jgi:Na+-translocating ferredoxin:NAD+ oxidoreductase RNF subunit RnfB
MIAAVASLTGLGIVAAVGLSVAAKVFHVDVDPRLEVIDGMLPGVNCGACGYAGCFGFAEGLLAGEVEATVCAPADEATIRKIAEYLGLEVGDMVRQVAVRHCGGGHGKAALKAQYDGIKECRATVLVGGGSKACLYACIGYGTCKSVCPFDAIVMGEDGLPVIIQEKCTACNKCVVACPRNIMNLEPEKHKVHVRCSSTDAGPRVKKVCQVGCTGCGICEKVCPVNAIIQENNLAAIDPATCIECGICASNCPTDAITDGLLPRAPVIISEECNGCTICAKVCPYDAITGEAKEQHVVDPVRCVGCGLCVERCPVQAISVSGGVEQAVA